jgi:ubiquinone/menaquinone biosynthesis C-methylase UbiE
MSAEDAKRETAALFDAVAGDYDQLEVGFFSVFGRRLVELAGVAPGQRVLDVGCGRGAALFPAAAAVGASGHVLGIDLAPAMIDALAADVRARRLTNVDVRVGDAEDPGVPDGSLDVVLGALVLSFLTNVERAVRAYRTALRPGGLLAFTTLGPIDERWERIERALVPYLPAGDRTDDGEPPTDPLETPEGIASVLDWAGFADATTREEVYPVRFSSPEVWEAWTWTTGMRAFWESIAPEHRDAARDEALRVVASLGDPDGGATCPYRVRYTLARRPRPQPAEAARRDTPRSPWIGSPGGTNREGLSGT